MKRIKSSDPSQMDDPHHEMGRTSRNDIKLQMTHLKK